jgi:YVTN family beta-propeller protein
LPDWPLDYAWRLNMEFRILGPLEVCSEGRELSLGGAKQRALLAVLLLHANEVVSVDRLVDELWGDRPPATASKVVQVYVSQLRKALRGRRGRDEEERVLVTRPPGYMLRVEPGQLDVDRFEELVDQARQELAAGSARRAAHMLLEALALWRGPALADFALDAFAQSEIARLEEARISAVEERIEADLALGRHSELVGELESLVTAHPFRERLRGQLMLALYRCDRQAEALAAYRDARRLLIEELGLEPSQALQGLEKAILVQDPLLAVAPVADSDDLPPGVGAMPGELHPLRVRSRLRRHLYAVLLTAVLLLAGGIAAAVVELAGGPALLRSVPVNSLALIDASTGRLKGGIAVGARPTAVVVRGGSVWVANFDEQTLSRVDPVTKKELTRIPAGGAPTGLAAGGGFVWVTHGFAGTVSRIDPGLNRITGTLQLGSGVADVAVAANAVWIVNGLDGTVLRIDPATGALVWTIAVGGSPTGVAADARSLWVADGRSVLKVDMATNRVVARIALRHQATRVAVGAGTVWVSANLDNVVTRIDIATGSAAVDIPVGEGPVGLAADAKAVWVADGLAGAVSRIDPAKNRVVATIPVGSEPGAVALVGGSVWVTVAAP